MKVHKSAVVLFATATKFSRFLNVNAFTFARKTDPMHQDHLTRATIIVVFVAVLSLKFTGAEFIHFYEVTEMPAFALPRLGWLLAKVIYFILFAYLLYQVSVKATPNFPPAFWMLLFLLLMQEGWFYFLIMTEDFQRAFFIKTGLAIFVLLNQLFISKFDKKLGWYFLPATLWLAGYELLLAYQLNLLNES